MELLPRAVLALGITGHRDLGANPSTPVIAATLDTLFANLSRAVRTVGQNEFFSKAEPFVRAVTMAAEGADLLGAQAAQNAGSALVCVLPFPFDEYQRDFSSPAADIARSIVERADAQFVFPAHPPREHAAMNAPTRSSWRISMCSSRFGTKNERTAAPAPGRWCNLRFLNAFPSF